MSADSADTLRLARGGAHAGALSHSPAPRWVAGFWPRKTKPGKVYAKAKDGRDLLAEESAWVGRRVVPMLIPKMA
jgi:hypothetical protein